MSGLATEVTGEGKWQTCPSTFGKATGEGLNCNNSQELEEPECLCRENMCWMNLSDQPSLSNWLIGTKGKYLQRRYSGLSLGTDSARNGSDKSHGVVVWYDNSVYHALPAFLSHFNNARLKRLVGKEFNITTVNHPIKFTSNSLSSMSSEQHVADLGIGLLILVSLTVVTSATGGYVVAERVRGERTVLYVAGLSHNLYWTAHMIWDALVIAVNVMLTAAVLLLFDQQQFIYRDNLAAFIFLAFLYGLSLLPLFYLVEGTFKSEASAVLSFFSAAFATGLITSLIVVTCQFYTWVADLDYDIGSKVITLKEMEGVLKYLFLVFPPFSFAFGVKDLSISYAKTAILSRFDIDIYVTPFSWDTKLQGGLGLHFLSLAIWAVLGTAVLHAWRKCLGPLSQRANSSRSLAGAEEDKDVAAERIKIQCGGASLYDTVLRIVGLGKDFTSPPSVAVSNLFLALRRGECFSLLGLNGAGKTTTFRCVTGELRPSRGQILINGQLLEEALAQPHPTMGYCPQSEALDPNLTPREALSVMALVRGFPDSEVSHVLRRALVQMGLLQDHNTYISQLSGGTKRKISTAMALLGNPVLVLLDEPTTGLDPSSRRGIWSAIKSVTQDGRTVLLTSHSMDEVNILSHRMAIMVNGCFVCLGSPHYLKNKLGDKYSIRIKTNVIEDMAAVVDFLRSQWMDVLLKEQHHLTLVMEVSRRLPLQLIFDCLNRAKELGVTEYDVSQTTLNEVFRLLTSHQDDGQLPPAPVRNESEQAGLPIHFSADLPQETSVMKTPEHTFHRKNTPFSPVKKPTAADVDYTLPAVETDRPHNYRSSVYDNVRDDQSEIYATIGKHRAVRPSPDIESFRSESGSSDESPEEEWTQL
ncbi:phospholipid-transporting ATPase ABCA1-like [Macrobrachium rosenbergii]|uniref:phospholipid-transporting ATPase ABCA1-like n=1 Tax=Macrobrachium rosenbergii TaxID=79674 RepID=UPI0034D3C2B4